MKVTIAGTARGFTENLFGTLADSRFNRGSIVMVVVAGAAQLAETVDLRRF